MTSRFYKTDDRLWNSCRLPALDHLYNNMMSQFENLFSFFDLLVSLTIAAYVVNSVDSGQTPCLSASDLGLHCFLRPVRISLGWIRNKKVREKSSERHKPSLIIVK